MIGDVYVCAREQRTKYLDGYRHTVTGFRWFSAFRVEAVDGGLFLNHEKNLVPVSRLRAWGSTEAEPLQSAQQRVVHQTVTWTAPPNTLGLSAFVELFGSSFSYGDWSRAARKALDLGVQASPLDMIALERGEAEQEDYRKLCHDLHRAGQLERWAKKGVVVE